MVKNLYIVTPRGFCAGVEMAIKALHWLLKIYDETIYCYHEIVHNKWIVKIFEQNNQNFTKLIFPIVIIILFIIPVKDLANFKSDICPCLLFVD